MKLEKKLKTKEKFVAKKFQEVKKKQKKKKKKKKEAAF